MSLPAAASRTVEQTRRWLTALRDALALEDEGQAWSVLRGVLHHLRDRLPTNEVADLGAQLPTLVRGLYYEGWGPAATPEKDRDRDSFMVRVAERMGGQPDLDFENACRAVFALLDAELDAGEINDVILTQPDDVRVLWPDAARERAEAA